MIAARLTELRMDEVGTGCHEPRGNPKLMKKSGCYLGPTQIRSISHDRRLDVGAGGGDVLLHFFSHFRKRVALDFPSAGIERDRIAFGQSHYDPCDGPSCLLQKTKKIRAVGPRRTPTVMTACATSFSLSTGGHIAIALRAGPLGHADSGPRGAAQPQERSIPERGSVRATAPRWEAGRGCGLGGR